MNSSTNFFLDVFLVWGIIISIAAITVFSVYIISIIPSIKEFFKLSIYNIRLVERNGRYYIRRGYFFYYQYYCFKYGDVGLSDKWHSKSISHAKSCIEAFSTTDKVKALKTYYEIRSKHLEKLENPDKEVIIK
jgi:hypothetical protein